ncbi:MAG: HAD hydrolase-like protein [Oscillospiraceae bacterium]
MKKNVILFDLDGTVIDSKIGIYNSILYTLNKLNLPLIDEDTMQKFLGPSIISSFINLVGLSEEKAELATTYYREYYSCKGIYECSLYNEIESIIEYLYSNGYKVGLATKKPQNFSVKILNHFGIDKYFSCICGSSMSETSTTKGHIIQKAALNLTSDLSKAVLIGDTIYDVQGAKEANIDFIGALYGYGNVNDISGYMGLINSPLELKKVLL